jgi:antitoxin YefM
MAAAHWSLPVPRSAAHAPVQGRCQKAKEHATAVTAVAKHRRMRPGDVRLSVQEVDLKTMSYTESRARYAEVLDSVTDDREEVVITRGGHEPVVIVSLADYESLRETAYLMRSPVNARRLLDAMERLEAGRGQTHELLETD